MLVTQFRVITVTTEFQCFLSRQRTADQLFIIEQHVLESRDHGELLSHFVSNLKLILSDLR